MKRENSFTYFSSNGAPGMSDAFRELAFGPWHAMVCRPWADAASEAFESLRLQEASTLDELDLAVGTATGRTRTYLLDLGEESRVHIRPYVHGGALARVTGNRFPSPDRFRDELRVHTQLAAQSAPVATPILVLWRRRGAFVEGAMGTSFIEGAVDGGEYLSRAREAPGVEAAVVAVAQATRRFHDAGGRHADLNLKNVMLEGEPSAPRAWLIDLDCASIATDVSPRRRMHELMRLERSVRKLGHRETLTNATRGSFIDAYCDGDAKLRESMLSHIRLERVRNDIHALFHPRVAR